MALTPEELTELAALEADDKIAKDSEADAIQRQHLDALRMKKRLAGKNGVHGTDFSVIETTAGNFAIRRPVDVEIDAVGENPEDRGTQEKYVASIILEPTREELQPLLGKFPGLVNALIPASFDLIGRVRKEESKK